MVGTDGKISAACKSRRVDLLFFSRDVLSSTTGKISAWVLRSRSIFLEIKETAYSPPSSNDMPTYTYFCDRSYLLKYFFDHFPVQCKVWCEYLFRIHVVRCPRCVRLIRQQGCLRIFRWIPFGRTFGFWLEKSTQSDFTGNCKQGHALSAL